MKFLLYYRQYSATILSPLSESTEHLGGIAVPEIAFNCSPSSFRSSISTSGTLSQKRDIALGRFRGAAGGTVFLIEAYTKYMSSPGSSEDIYEETLTVFEQTNYPNEPLTGGYQSP